MKRIISLLLALTLSLSVTCVTPAATDTINKEQTLTMKDITTKGYKFTKSQKKLWSDILKVYRKGKKGRVSFKENITKEEVVALVENKSHLKEIKYTDDKFGKYTFISYFGQKEVTVTFNMNKIRKMINSSKKTEKKINKIVKKLKLNKRTTQEDAAIRINNYVVNKIEYDETLKKHSITDALAGSSVCSGYAKLYKFLCNKVGLRCQIITGYGNNISHAWNRVKINGKWRYVDTTWNDTTETNDYLLITKEKMNEDHIQLEIKK